MILLIVLLIYYWYFYYYILKGAVKPTSGFPSTPAVHNVAFHSITRNRFQFTLNGQTAWEHTLPVDTFTMDRDRILRVDSCHGVPDGQSVVALGKPLYEYLIANPSVESTLKFKENSPFTIQSGNVFYFKCLKGRVESLHMCPSGTTFLRNACQPISSCTGKLNGTLFNHAKIRSKYIECRNGMAVDRDCPDRHIFNHNRCENVQNLHHYCKIFSEPFYYDPMTRIKCRNQKPYYVRCKKGTRFFDKDYCEPDHCVGLPDGTVLPLPKQKIYSLEFVPGYMTCQGNKIDKLVQCSQNWDSTLSEEDDMTSFPMVFDGHRCSNPVFCESVFSDDPDVIVPSYNFVKHVSNWKFSKFLDYTVGHTCENKIRKRKNLSPGEVISKQFKIEPACGPSMPEKLPIYDDPFAYYDCVAETVIRCPLKTFFNGSQCLHLPENAFYHEKFPLFGFDSLNKEFWIKPWDYSNEEIKTCQDPESHYLQSYNVCSHPDCSKYPFLSQIPEFEILLPREKRAKCKYHEAEKSIKKEPVPFDYRFWEQKRVKDSDEKELCTPGQRIQSGNFIWDRTVYATCHLDQPFVFCPSTHTFDIFLVDKKLNLFACRPPAETQYTLDSKDWTLYETNEIKRILPASIRPTSIRRSKGSRMEPLPPDGIFIQENIRIQLAMTQPVKIEPRYRVTYPPNVVFHYKKDTHEIKTSSDYSFLVKLKNFTDKPLAFPRYQPIIYADSFKENVNS